MAAKVKALEQWCRLQCDGYRDVNVTNMTSSWRSGLAFCAMIHRYRPDLIDYDSLRKEDVYENNKLAFEVAERELGIPALLDAEDMVAMKVPDKLCVVTYVAQYHNYFRKLKPAEGGSVQPAKTSIKRTAPTPTPSEPPQLKKPVPPQDAAGAGDTVKRATLGETCSICGLKVYIMERIMEGNKLFHRRCLRDKQKSERSSWENSLPRKGPTQNGTSHSSAPQKTVPSDNNNLSKEPSSLTKALYSYPKYPSSGVASESKPVDSSKTVSAVSWNVSAGPSSEVSRVQAHPEETPENKKPSRPTNFTGQSRPTRRDMLPRAGDKTGRQQPGNTTSSPTVTSSSETPTVNGLLQSLAHIRQTRSSPTLPPPESSQRSNLKASSDAHTPIKTVTIKAESPSTDHSSHHRPILKSVDTAQSPRARSTSPPKSILKHGAEHASPVEPRSDSRSSSPPKSILKHMEFSPDTKQEDAPPRSILKRGSFDSDAESEDGTFPKPKSILKRDSIGSDPDSGPNSRVTSPSRSILKSSPEKLSGDSEDELTAARHKLRQVSPRSILKRNSLDMLSSDSTHDTELSSPSTKSILKSASPSRENRPRSILKHQKEPARSSPVRTQPDPATSKTSTKDNNFSAFNLSDSICLKDSVPKKPAWQLEAELRQGAKSPGTPPKEPAKKTSKPATKKEVSGSSGKLEWQIEAERRQAKRGGKYEDPEKKFKTTEDSTDDKPGGNLQPTGGARPKTPEEKRPVKVDTAVGGKAKAKFGQSSAQTVGKVIHKGGSNVPQYSRDHLPDSLRDRLSPPNPLAHFGEPSEEQKRANLSRSPAFRIPDSSPEMSPSPPHSASHRSPASTHPTPDHSNEPTFTNPVRKKVTPDVDFSFASHDWNRNHRSTSPPPVPPPRHTRAKPGQGIAPINMMDIPKRKVHAEARMCTADILSLLTEMDDQLHVLETQGRGLEQRIRSSSDEAMDEDVLMVQWFELVNDKNELVRKESDLMYRLRQQELEDHHEDLEYELRMIMAMSEGEKTVWDREREEALLKELMDTVIQRNVIVDSIEEDRLRYKEEDEEIAEMLAATTSQKKKKNGKKHKVVEREASPEYELDELDVAKEQEKSRKKEKKLLRLVKGGNCVS